MEILQKAEMMNHQKTGLACSRVHPKWAFFWDTGTGKTRLGCEIIKDKNFPKTLIVCPKTIIESVWLTQIFIWLGPNVEAVDLRKTYLKRKKFPSLFTQALQMNIGIVSFEIFKLMPEQIVKAKYKCLIIDESAKIANPLSAISKMVNIFSSIMCYVYLFTGTPAGNSWLDYYAQISCIDASVWGKNYYSFRNKYFYKPNPNGFTWLFKKDKEEEFKKKLQTVSSSILKESVLDLPPRTENVRLVELSKKERSLYDLMHRGKLTTIEGKEILTPNIAARIMKLRQITSGFILCEDECKKKKKEAIIFGDSKLIELKNVIRELGENQAVIWFHFSVDGQLIQDMIATSFATSSKVVDGATKEQDRLDAIKQFQNKELRYLVTNPATCGEGLNLENCSYAIYYDLVYSYKLMYQSKDRIYRKGQKNKCTYIYLLAVNTVDEIIYNCFIKNLNLNQAILKYIQDANYSLKQKKGNKNV